jgi:Na+/H+ antiporter NhaD/arsenite permease-like protein
MNPSAFEMICTALFVGAIVHTFSVFQFQKLARRYPEGSVGENFFHLIGEVEVVFGIWAALLFCVSIYFLGYRGTTESLEALNFNEPAFVFVIMVVAATSPVMQFASGLIQRLVSLIPASPALSFYVVALILGPLMGSFITEPAAMTVTALLLKDRLFDQKVSLSFKYATLGLLFVNISIGGTLTHYAAPPILMVASTWNWDTLYMMEHFGYKTIIAVVLNVAIVSFLYRKEFSRISEMTVSGVQNKSPAWLVGVHLLFLAFIVANAHHMVIFIPALLFFIGVTVVTKEYQTELRVKEALLVGFFLGGLVVLGGPQKWWLEPILGSVGDLTLFLGAAALTAVVDNAALTFLGAQVPNLSEFSKYALVAGAVTGGGLTVIANAPNPAGYGILQGSFAEGISPLGLFKGALLPTLVALLAYWFLPTFSF